MLRHNSNIALQFIFFTSIPHNDTHIKASKVSNFNEACKLSMIAFSFKYLLSQIIMTSNFGQLVYHSLMPPQNCHALFNDLLHVHVSKFCKNSSNSALLASFLIVVNPIFLVKLSNHCFNIVVLLLDNTSRLKILYALKMSKLWNLLFKLSIIACTYMMSSKNWTSWRKIKHNPFSHRKLWALFFLWSRMDDFYIHSNMLPNPWWVDTTFLTRGAWHITMCRPIMWSHMHEPLVVNFPRWCKLPSYVCA